MIEILKFRGIRIGFTREQILRFDCIRIPRCIHDPIPLSNSCFVPDATWFRETWQDNLRASGNDLLTVQFPNDLAELTDSYWLLSFHGILLMKPGCMLQTRYITVLVCHDFWPFYRSRMGASIQYVTAIRDQQSNYSFCRMDHIWYMRYHFPENLVAYHENRSEVVDSEPQDRPGRPLDYNKLAGVIQEQSRCMKQNNLLY